MPLAADGHLPLLHRLEQGGLRLGRRAVDLVGQDDVGEDRPPQELELADAGRLVLLDHLGAGDVRGHQVGRELDPVVGQVERIGQRVDHQRLGQAGHADQQAVPAGEDRDQQLLEDRVLADDDLGHLALELGERVLEPLDGGEVVVLERLAGAFRRSRADLPWSDSHATGRAAGTLDGSEPVPVRVRDSSEVYRCGRGTSSSLRSPSAQSPPRVATRARRGARRTATSESVTGKTSRCTSSPVSRRRKTRGSPSISLSAPERRGPGVGQHAALGQGQRPARLGAGQVARPDERPVGQGRAPLDASGR